MYETQCQELCGHWGRRTQWEGMQDGLVPAHHRCSTENTVQEEMAHSLKKYLQEPKTVKDDVNDYQRIPPGQRDF